MLCVCAIIHNRRPYLYKLIWYFFWRHHMSFVRKTLIYDYIFTGTVGWVGQTVKTLYGRMPRLWEISCCPQHRTKCRNVGDLIIIKKLTEILQVFKNCKIQQIFGEFYSHKWLVSILTVLSLMCSLTLNYFSGIRTESEASIHLRHWALNLQLFRNCLHPFFAVITVLSRLRPKLTGSNTSRHRGCDHAPARADH